MAGPEPVVHASYESYNPNRKRDAIILMLILKAECLSDSVRTEPEIRFEANVE